jgi:hypothetical protein
MASRPEIISERERNLFVLKLTQWIWLFFGILEGLIGLRVLLKLLGANPGALFAQFVYNLTYPFLLPFIGLTEAPAAGNSVFETDSLIAMFVYLLLVWVIFKVIGLAVYKPSERRIASISDVERSGSSASDSKPRNVGA